MKSTGHKLVKDPVNAGEVNFALLDIYKLLENLPIFIGRGDPTNNVAAKQGSLYLRLDGGTATTLYVKESGQSTKQGWVAEGGGGSGAPINATYITQTPDPTLTNEQALSLLSSGLMVATTATGVVLTRILTQPAAGITISNNDGIVGNPTFALANDLAALEAMAGTGIVARTASETYAQRAVSAGSTKISVSNGDGVAGNPSVDAVEANFTLNNIGGTLNLAKGGTNNSLTADNGAIPYSDASKIALLASTATANKALMSGASGAPTWSIPTFPNASAISGKFIRSDGTNWVASTPTLPTAAGTAGKVLQSDGTNYVESTPTYPSASGTSGKVLISDGTNNVYSTPTFPNASAASGKFIRSDGTNWIASTPTLPTSAGTSGKVLQSNGTNYVESTPTYPSASGGAGVIITSDGTNNVYTTATYPATTTINQVLYSSSGNVVGGLATANTGTLITDSTGIPRISAKGSEGWFYNLSIQKATTTNTNDSFKITGFDGTALSSTNTAWVDLPDPANPGRLKRFAITADVTVKISGATWGIPANVTGAILRISACNDNGTLRWCIAYSGNLTTFTTTNTTSTPTSATNPESVLCNSAVVSSTNSNRELGYVIADFTQSTAVWAIETGVFAVITGQSPDGIWQPWSITFTGFSVNPTVTTARWTQVGFRILVEFNHNAAGTSNATTLTMGLPIKAKNAVIGVARGEDNGTFGTAPALLSTAASSVTLTANKDFSGAAWTNTGSKVCQIGAFEYEMGP